MSDIFKEIDERLGRKTSKLQVRIRFGWRLIIAWMIFSGFAALGALYVIIHFISKFW